MTRYRQLDAWKNARSLLITTFRTLRKTRNPESFALFDQIRRAAVSIEANIAEGYALHTTPQLLRHLRIAFGSAAEVETLVDAASELGLLDAADARNLSTICRRCSATIFELMRSVSVRG